SESVYRRMEAERKQEANRLRATGAADGERIRAQADRQRAEMLAEAYAEAQAIMGEGDGAAAAIYAEAYGRNPDFYAFYRSLESSRASFGGAGDTLVISPQSDFFRFWGDPSGQAAGRGAGAAPAMP